MAVLETLVRELAGQRRGDARPTRPGARRPAAVHRRVAAPVAPPPDIARSACRRPRTAAAARRPSPAARAVRAALRVTARPEQWIGQRVLLAIGVVALLMAAGYLLKLSFDRGLDLAGHALHRRRGRWASRWARSAGGSATLPHLRRRADRLRAPASST